ncbi:MAG TPA: glycosyltransferase family 2 protein [Puia sp.]|nr:glycosyltransferase family 2 protein [Puia sp.]
MSFWLFLFGACCLIVLYNYAGYAVIAWLLNRFRRPVPLTEPGDWPGISFIVAAYNEEDCIAAKIANSLALDYPRDRIEFLFISDGSTDKTESIVRAHPEIRSLHRPERAGKSAALNRAVGQASMDILVFSDANTVLNHEALRNIARHYQDPATGGVAGEKKVLSAPGSDEVGQAEGLYWKYESSLKKIDASFYSVVGAAGELFSFRRSLFEPIPHTVILDDFVSSLKVAQRGYRIAYEPAAFAMELPSLSLGDERKRKVRIAAGGFQAIGMLKGLFAFWKYPRLSFLYISHRVLRWAVSPFCLVGAFIANGVLVVERTGALFTALFIAQCLLYASAALAGVQPALRRLKPVRLAYYFVFMNFCAVLGFFRYLKGNQSAAWEKARRATVAP